MPSTVIQAGMTTQVAPLLGDELLERISSTVRRGLTSHPKSLPPWLFYDDEGSRLFEQITELPEYYLTRTERCILRQHARAIVAQAGENRRLRIIELGAGSAEKTRLLLSAAVDRQTALVYEPIDISESALDVARARIEREIPGVRVAPRTLDYTNGLHFGSTGAGERRLVLSIGSSIGNFEPDAAAALLGRVRARLEPGDAILLGVDLRKDDQTLVEAYNDSEGVTAAFNLNLLVRLNRELGADFDLDNFVHRAVWNRHASRIEMHLESRSDRTVRIPALDLAIGFAEGETIHTENSYKYSLDSAEAMLAAAGFAPLSTWTDAKGWFAVCLGRAG